MSVTDIVEQVQARLAKLLMRSFGSAELRAFVRFGRGGEALACELPGPEVPLSQLAHAVIEILERRGLLNEEFFACLRTERPEHKHEVDEIERALSQALVHARDRPTLASSERPFMPARQPELPWPDEVPVDLWAHLTTEDDLYTGRDHDIQTLGRWASAPDVKAIAVTGFGGLGKTALVGQWINHAGGRTCRSGLEGMFGWSFYSDRHVPTFFASLLDYARRRGLEPSSNKHPEANRIAPLGSRVSTLLRHHSLLLVLDGLEVLQEDFTGQAANYGKFLDAGLGAVLDRFCHVNDRNNHGLVVLTSRFAFSDLTPFLGRSVRVLRLDALEPEDGAALLEKCGVSGSSEELRVVASSLDGHPLALRLFAKVATEGHVGTPTHLLSRVLLSGTSADDPGTTDGGPDRKLVKLLEFYSRSICAIHQSILAAIALFMEPIDTATIVKIVMGLARRSTAEDITRQIERLVRERLVLRELNSSRVVCYSCHPVIKDYFRRTIGERGELVAAILGFSVPVPEFVEDEYAGWGEFLTQGKPSRNDPSERAFVIATVALFVENGEYLRADILFRTRLGDGMVFIDSLSVHQGLQCVLLFVGEEVRRQKCERLLSPRRLVYFLHLAGLLSLGIGEIARAIEFYQAACQAAARVGKTTSPLLLPNLSRPLVLRGDLAAASAQLYETLSWAEPLSFAWETYSCYMNLAHVRGLMGHVDDALRLFREAGAASEMWWDLCSAEVQMDSSLEIKRAMLLLRVGDVAEARNVLDQYRDELAARSGIVAAHECARVRSLCGWADVLTGHLEAAEEHLDGADEVFRGGLWIEDMLLVLISRCRLECARRQWDDARNYAEEALSIAMSRGMKLFHADALGLRARILLESAEGSSSNALFDARDAAEMSLSIATDCEYLWARLDALRTLGACCRATGQRQPARRYEEELVSVTVWYRAQCEEATN